MGIEIGPPPTPGGVLWGSLVGHFRALTLTERMALANALAAGAPLASLPAPLRKVIEGCAALVAEKARAAR